MRARSLLPALILAAGLPGALPARTVAVTARKFEFTPAVVHLKTGEPVTLQFRTEDRRHGISCRGLDLDLDISPGKVAEAVLTPRQAGTFPAVCSRLCGSGHDRMRMTFVVDP